MKRLFTLAFTLLLTLGFPLSTHADSSTLIKGSLLELREAASHGKLAGCPFSIGDKQSTVVAAWGEPKTILGSFVCDYGLTRFFVTEQGENGPDENSEIFGIQQFFAIRGLKKSHIIEEFGLPRSYDPEASQLTYDIGEYELTFFVLPSLLGTKESIGWTQLMKK